ncbi:hypothetical protein FF2_005518 [Malus domestica]
MENLGQARTAVIDGSKVELGDLEDNFMVDKSNVGKSKVNCVRQFLQELLKFSFVSRFFDCVLPPRLSILCVIFCQFCV